MKKKSKNVIHDAKMQWKVLKISWWNSQFGRTFLVPLVIGEFSGESINKGILLQLKLLSET